jgi:hypothetical protein
MYNFLKKLFGVSSVKEYGMGAIESPADPRNIQLASFQMPVGLPEKFMAEMPVVENQVASQNALVALLQN